MAGGSGVETTLIFFTAEVEDVPAAFLMVQVRERGVVVSLPAVKARVGELLGTLGVPPELMVPFVRVQA